MLPRVTRGPLIKRLCAVAVVAGGAVCALEGFLDAAAAVDGGEPPLAAAAPEFEGVPAGTPPDAGSAAQSRRRYRRWKRMGGPDAGVPTVHDAGVPHDAGRDAIARGAPVPPPRPIAPQAIVPPPPPQPAPNSPSTSQPVTELGFNTCQKIPRGKRVVKMNLKPDVELPELVAWISSITCKSFVLPSNLAAGGKKITFITQGAMTRDEAYAAFLTALDSVGLTVARGPGYLKIIETSKAKTSSTQVYGFDGQPTRGKSSSAGD